MHDCYWFYTLYTTCQMFVISVIEHECQLLKPCYYTSYLNNVLSAVYMNIYIVKTTEVRTQLLRLSHCLNFSLYNVLVYRLPNCELTRACKHFIARFVLIAYGLSIAWISIHSRTLKTLHWNKRQISLRLLNCFIIFFYCG